MTLTYAYTEGSAFADALLRLPEPGVLHWRGVRAERRPSLMRVQYAGKELTLIAIDDPTLWLIAAERALRWLDDVKMGRLCKVDTCTATRSQRGLCDYHAREGRRRGLKRKRLAKGA